MVKRVVHPEGSAAMAHLSTAIAAGDLLFVSGQTAADAVGIEAQTHAVIKKLGAILKAAGLDLSAVLRCGVYLSDMRYRAEMNRIYLEYFSESPPARTTIECKLAEPSMLIEIDCVALLG